MESKYKTKTVYFITTDTAIYRSDEIFKQLDDWIQALKVGQLIRVETADSDSLDEYEAHLADLQLESQKLVREEVHFEF